MTTFDLLGSHLLDGTSEQGRGPSFRARAPREGRELDPSFPEATPDDVDRAASLAAAAAAALRSAPAHQIGDLLDRIAASLGEVGEALIARAVAETALGPDRLAGELARTQNQLRMFAALVRHGDWRDARIDRALPDRKPIPRPDLRRMLVPIGPVAVWGASNFPLAFSVAGGDTASALAAGNPVVIKAHPAHPGTSELAGRAVAAAVSAAGLPAGVFSLIHGRSPEVSLALVRHPLIRAGAFTGSLRAGRALYDAAAGRPDPIPFFAEMGSVNPVFVLPGAAATRAEAIADGLFQSVNLGVGQFCTNPGVVAAIDDASTRQMANLLRQRFSQAPTGTMLYAGVRDLFDAGVERIERIPGVTVSKADAAASAAATEARPVFFEAPAGHFLAHANLREEVFGPASILLYCSEPADLVRIAESLEGNLTATLHGSEEDLLAHRDLVRVLETRVGRLIVNGYPTGVEVAPAMHHGGPYPATTDVRFTSVGTAAIQRFARPICYQNFPQALLPVELQDLNELGLQRLVDGEPTRQPLDSSGR